MANLVLKWLEQQIDSLRDYASKHINLLWDWVFYLDNVYKAIREDLSDLADDVSNIPSEIRKALEGVKVEILTHVKGDLIDPLSYHVDAFQTDVQDWIASLRGDMSDIREDLVTVIDFISHIDDIIDARIDGFKDKIIGWVECEFISIIEHVLEQEVKE